jgi:hypothetical protein
MHRWSDGTPVDGEALCAGTTRRGERCRNAPLACHWFCADHGGGARPADAPAAAAWAADARRRMDELRARPPAR